MLKSIRVRHLSVALSVLLFAALSPLARSQDAPKLVAGQPAPSMKIAKWIKGKKVDKLEKGKVYVVEFWATWCGPCKVSIPHLTELAKKYKDKVTFVGVDSFEVSPEDIVKGKNGEPEHFAAVEKFVKDMGKQMDYNVGIDTTDGDMAKNWMDAAGQEGIPTAFIVDQDSCIAWIGHPMDDMDKVIDKVLAKTWNVDEEKKKADNEKKAAADASAKFMKAQELIDQGDHKGAVEVLNEVYATAPEVGRNFLMPIIAGSMVFYDEAGTYAKIKEWLDKGEMTNPSTMNEIAWDMMTKAEYKKPDYDIAVRLAQKAVDGTKSEDGMIMDTLALATFKKGNVDKAIDLQTKAIELVKKMIAGLPTPNEELNNTLKDMEGRLEYFKKQKGG